MSRLVNSTQEIRPLKARRSLSNLFERKRSASKSDVVTMPIPTPTPIPRENLSLGTTRTRQLAPVDPLLRKSLAFMDDELNALGIRKLPPSPRSPTNTELKNIELGIAGQALDYSETRSAGMDRLGSGKENNWSDETEQRRLSLSAFQLPAGRMSFAGFGDFTDSLGEDLALADYDTTPVSSEIKIRLETKN